MTEELSFSYERNAEWHEWPALSLDEHGVIQDCTRSCESLFGYPCRELISQPITTLFPGLFEEGMIKEGQFTPLFHFHCRCGHIFQAQNRHGELFSSMLSSVLLENDGRRIHRLIVRCCGEKVQDC